MDTKSCFEQAVRRDANRPEKNPQWIREVHYYNESGMKTCDNCRKILRKVQGGGWGA